VLLKNPVILDVTLCDKVINSWRFERPYFLHLQSQANRIDPEVEETTIFQKFGYYSSKEAPSHPKRFHHWLAELSQWEKKLLHICP
jgi:hypothetical protein